MVEEAGDEIFAVFPTTCSDGAFKFLSQLESLSRDDEIKNDFLPRFRVLNFSNIEGVVSLFW